jgi:hypothetical protein
MGADALAGVQSAPRRRSLVTGAICLARAVTTFPSVRAGAFRFLHRLPTPRLLIRSHPGPPMLPRGHMPTSQRQSRSHVRTEGVGSPPSGRARRSANSAPPATTTAATPNTGGYPATPASGGPTQLPRICASPCAD